MKLLHIIIFVRLAIAFVNVTIEINVYFDFEGVSIHYGLGLLPIIFILITKTLN